jgi:hypothetical protein
MKNTQKKLKAKHFRYLSKDIIKNPMIYVRNFYRYETSLHTWLKNIDLLVNAGTYPEMASPDFFESGFHCKQLIQHVEVAYVIYHQCKVPNQKHPLSLFGNKEDYHNYVFRWEYTFNGKADPTDALSKFFSFQSLNEWYTTLDDLWMYMTIRKSSYYDKFGDKILAIKELLLRLAYAMYTIYEDEGLSISVPSYFIADPADPHQGKMPLSKLGEFIHDAIDKQYEKHEKEKPQDIVSTESIDENNQ